MLFESSFAHTINRDHSLQRVTSATHLELLATSALTGFVSFACIANDGMSSGFRNVYQRIFEGHDRSVLSLPQESAALVEFEGSIQATSIPSGVVDHIDMSRSVHFVIAKADRDHSLVRSVAIADNLRILPQHVLLDRGVIFRISCGLGKCCNDVYGIEMSHRTRDMEVSFVVRSAR